MLVSYEDLKTVHLELSEHCNAGCPMCPRTENGGPANPNLNGSQITIETITNSFSPEKVAALEGVQFCGNFGDPISARDALEIVTYFRTHNRKIKMMFNTNGGARPPQWWAKLGEQMREPGSFVVFGIDGLESTNHIYRRNVKWDKLMANATAFIAAGGIARWEYLLFKHNQHQVSEANQLANEMGFNQFITKKTARFFDFDEAKIVPFPVFNENRITESFLEPPDEDTMNNPVAVKKKNNFAPQKRPWIIERKLKKWSRNAKLGWMDFVNTINPPTELASDLTCYHTAEKSIYVSARGEVLPCCLWGGQIRYADPGVDGRKINKLASKSVGGLHEASLHKNSLKDLMSGKWFRTVEKSLCAPAGSKHRVGTCGRLCTRQSEIVKSEFL